MQKPDLVLRVQGEALGLFFCAVHCISGFSSVQGKCCKGIFDASTRTLKKWEQAQILDNMLVHTVHIQVKLLCLTGCVELVQRGLEEC